MTVMRKVSLSCLFLVAIVVLLACNSDSSQQSQAPSVSSAPTAQKDVSEGAALLETRCSVCHNANKPKAAKKTMEQWDQTVTRMIGKGAKLTEVEKKVLVEHLAATYKP
jgi:cytochrome c5